MTQHIFSQLRVSIAAGAARITIDNPPVNVLGFALISELSELLTSLAGDSAVRVLVFDSANPAINQLKAVLIQADPALRESMTGLSNTALFRRCAEINHCLPSDTASAAAFTLRLLAQRIVQLTSEVDELNAQLAVAAEARAPQLLQRYGVGPDTAAALLLAVGDNPERLHNESSFAALCGVSPVEASSGKTHRRRLNRGGNRQANSALYTITIARLRWDKRTQDYLQRRINEGKTRREAIRCLKRYIARESTGTSPRRRPRPRLNPHNPLLDIHRGIKHALTFLGGVHLSASVLHLR